MRPFSKRVWCTKPVQGSGLENMVNTYNNYVCFCFVSLSAMTFVGWLELLMWAQQGYMMFLDPSQIAQLGHSEALFVGANSRQKYNWKQHLSHRSMSTVDTFSKWIWRMCSNPKNLCCLNTNTPPYSVVIVIFFKHYLQNSILYCLLSISEMFDCDRLLLFSLHVKEKFQVHVYPCLRAVSYLWNLMVYRQQTFWHI